MVKRLVRNSLRPCFLGLMVIALGCGESGTATKTAPEPNVGPAAIPGGGPAEAPPAAKKAP